MNNGNLVLVRGVPGTGKSTFGELLALVGEGRVRHLEADQFFCVSGQYRFDPAKLHAAHKWCQEETQLAMLQKYPLIVVTNTFTRNKEMNPYRNFAATLGYRVTILSVERLHPPCALAHRNVHGVPEHKIVEMLNRWEQVEP